MFEDAIFESTGRIHTGSSRWMMATFALNGTILLTLVAIPLIYPEALPQHALPMPLTPPPAPPTPPPLLKELHPLQGASEMPTAVTFALPIMPRPGANSDDAPTAADGPITMNTGWGVSDAPTSIFSGHRGTQVVHSEEKGPVRVSSGVMEGIAIRKTMPVYPAIAREAHVQGVVTLQATIAKNGTIENLRVVNGPAMLQQAAINAVKAWRYRPYLLNGEPVEVETTVNVDFSLGR